MEDKNKQTQGLENILGLTMKEISYVNQTLHGHTKTFQMTMYKS
jgi:hypothetical protein